ncbi:MAG TPA: F0F1 ATP synthase subunit alpha [Phycisphaerae bacterium]|nr:F0F1 ATP synthase subunit alpha [Phycisphaerae bacterium]HUT61845.1 F0F1 ATP synthase subunit alpha [Phycisphaerae bacterium]
MKFRPDEVASVIREEIASFQGELDVANVGRVVEVGDGIAQIFGLSEAMAGEMLLFDNGAIGQVFNLEESSVGAVIYGEFEQIKAGDGVRTTGKLLEVPVGREMIGRVIDPLGRPLDGQGPVRTTQARPVETPAPGIAERQPVNEPLSTGIKAVDAMTPIGRGQRELIIGDRKTGKTSIAVDTIINQVGTDVICVYVAIGQKESTVAGVVDTLRSGGAMDHTVVVSASSSDPAPLQYIAPYSGCAIAEHFMYSRGVPTLVVYDDLTKQAVAYRQISLLLRRPPGREAYPGDVFYLHSRLLERACKLAERYVIAPADGPLPEHGVNDKEYVGPAGLAAAQEDLKQCQNPESLAVRRLPATGGSMTALPICETQEGEVSAYIPTNLISITDGQIYLEPSLFFAGIRPAINVGISVSRVGYKAAWPAMRDVAKGLRLDLAAFRELEAFAQLGVELDAATERQLQRGHRMVRLLTQELCHPYPVVDQVISIFAGTSGCLDDLPVEEVVPFENGLLEYVRAEHGDLRAELEQERTLPPERRRRLKFITSEYAEGPYVEQRRARSRQADTKA